MEEQQDNNQEIKLGKKVKIGLLVCIVITVISLIVFIYWVLFKLVTLLIPSILGYFLILLSIYFLFYSIVRFLVFPGSFTLWRRNMENTFQKDIARRSAGRFYKLKSLVEYLDAQNIVCDKQQQNNQQENSLNNKNSSFFDIQYDYDDIIEIRQTLFTLQLQYDGLAQNKKLSLYQQVFYNHFQNLIQLLSGTKIQFFEQTQEQYNNNENLKELIFDKYIEISEYLTAANIKIDHKQAQKIIDQVDIILNICNDLTSKKELKYSVQQIMFNDTFGTIDQLRVEMMHNFKAKQFLLKGYDNKLIDCMFIPTKDDYKPQNILQKLKDDNATLNYNALNQQLGKGLFKLDDTVGPTLIFCNPNAGFYEFLYYDSDWMEYYTKQGINIVVWNYRGYGNSQGWPSPNKIKADAELLVDHLRSHFKVKTLGIHGQSLGGMFATHLARKKKLDFLLADRSFGTLSDVAIYGLGRIFKVLFRLIVRNWDLQSGKNFANTKCFKIVAFDPKDEIIPYLASVKNSSSKCLLAKQINKHKKGNKMIEDYDDEEENDFLYVGQSNNIFFKIRKFILKQYISISTFCSDTWGEDNRIRQGANVLLNDSEMVQLFYALQRITDIIKVVAQNKNKQKNEQFKELYKGTPPTKIRVSLQKIQLTQQQSLDDQKEEMSDAFNNTLKSPMSPQPESQDNINNNQDQNLQLNKQNSNNKGVDVSPINIGSLNETKENIIPNTTDRLGSDENLIGENSYKQCIKQQESKDILTQISDELKFSEDFQNFMLNVYQLLDYIDAGGISLSDLFIHFKSDRLLIFQQFLVNLQIYGSNSHWGMIKDNLNDLDQRKQILFSKMKNFREQMKIVLQEQKQNGNVYQDQVKSMILEDLETINKNILQIFNRISRLELNNSNNSDNNSSGKINNNSNVKNQQSIQFASQKLSSQNSISTVASKKDKENIIQDIELGDLKKILNNKEEDEEDNKQQRNSTLQTENFQTGIQQTEANITNNKLQENQSGHVLQLSCGHNGIYSRKESHIYSQYLKASGFILDFDKIQYRDEGNLSLSDIQSIINNENLQQ